MLETERPDLSLSPLARSAAAELHDLIQKNRDHLTAHGDYAEQVAMSRDQVEAELASDSGNLRFGIVLGGTLIGRIDLVAGRSAKIWLGLLAGEGGDGAGLCECGLARTDRPCPNRPLRNRHLCRRHARQCQERSLAGALGFSTRPGL